jgi:hypothetical protein
MFSVGLDEIENLILYSQLIATKIEKTKNKPLISRFHLHLLATQQVVEHSRARAKGQ